MVSTGCIVTKIGWLLGLWFLVDGMVLPDTTTKTMTDGESQQQQSPQLYLMSLQYSDDFYSQQQRELWRWKDSILGDGRDFFIPRPKAIRKLQQYLVDDSLIEDCVVLSNCARFEILLRSSQATLEADIINTVSNKLWAQVLSSSKQRFHLPIDWAGAIDLHAVVVGDRLCELDGRHWTIVSGTESILRHLCEISAGLAMRPRRPSRPVRFRPFSSRDAHILLQLKRTVDLCEDPELIRILQASLSAGKAARNPRVVDSLNNIKPYGSGDTKYDSTPPQFLLDKVVQDVLALAIEPIVQDYLDDLESRKHKDDIVNMRNAACELAESSWEHSFVQRSLHEPTMRLRQGKPVDQKGFLLQLQSDLNKRRKAI